MRVGKNGSNAFFAATIIVILIGVRFWININDGGLKSQHGDEIQKITNEHAIEIQKITNHHTEEIQKMKKMLEKIVDEKNIDEPKNKSLAIYHKEKHELHLENPGTKVNTRIAFPGIYSIDCIDVNEFDLFLKPPFPVCLHPVEDDKFISGSIKNRVYHEIQSVTNVLRFLKDNPKWNFIDIGCNIGAFSIPVLKMGRKVVAVEALQKNIMVFKKSIQLGNWHDNVTLIHNAVYDKRTTVTFKFKKENIAGTHIVENATAKNRVTDELVESIIIDDLLHYVNFKDA
ncbi:unnamed protein product, partial [Owenia fusiformis]